MLTNFLNSYLPLLITVCRKQKINYTHTDWTDQTIITLHTATPSKIYWNLILFHAGHF